MVPQHNGHESTAVSKAPASSRGAEHPEKRKTRRWECQPSRWLREFIAVQSRIQPSIRYASGPRDHQRAFCCLMRSRSASLGLQTRTRLTKNSSRAFPLPVPPKQFIQAEREICTCRQEQRSPSSRKDRSVEWRLYSQGYGHRQREGNQKNSA